MPKRRGMSIVDRTGERYGRLVVVARADNRVEPSGAVRAQWRCRCDCGSAIVTSGQSLSRGTTRSCGCLIKEARRSEATHGQASSPLYRIWANMKQRCGNPKSTHWASYGGRGIVVCERWQSFENFAADIPPRPSGATLERIENNKGYEPGNVVWATRLAQAQNRRSNIYLTFEGLTLTAAGWGRQTGFGKSTILRRLAAGWSLSRTLTEPKNVTGERRRKRSS